MRQKFEEHFDELTRVLTQDHGRTIGESRGSVRRCIENIESACSAAYGMAARNEHIDQLASGIDMWMTWEPLGAFLIVSARQHPDACVVLFRSLRSGRRLLRGHSARAARTPLPLEYVNRVALEAGWPKGAINMIHGGRAINKYVLEQPEIQGLGFIGSTTAGKDLFEFCGKLGKNSSINGNGKNTVVVMPDADVETIVPFIRQGCFGMTGQRCLGSDNVVVVGDIYEKFKALFVAEAQRLKLGYGLDETTGMGPYCTAAGRDKVIAWVEGALSEGAAMVLDGRRPPPHWRRVSLWGRRSWKTCIRICPLPKRRLSGR